MSEGDSPFESGRFRYRRLGQEDEGKGAGEQAGEGKPGKNKEKRSRPSRRKRDRVLGIVLGILIGAAVIIAFTFYGSVETIDDPSLEREEQPVQRAPFPAPPEQPPPPRQPAIPPPVP